MTLLVTAAEMRHLETTIVEQGGATWRSLMEQAGAGMAEHALALIAEPSSAQVLILVGPGNNGGDGLVIARHLVQAGVQVTLYVWKRRPDETDAVWHAVVSLPIRVLYAAEDDQQQQLATHTERADLIIDALLGIGVQRPLQGLVAAIVERVNGAEVPLLAVDVPSGLDADTGAVWGSVVKADVTVTAGLIKRGLRLYPGAAAVGRLECVPIDLPVEMEIHVKELSKATLRSLMPQRPQDSHKDVFGRVMVVAGSLFYPGAAWMTAAAAARSGAGVITVACPRSIYGATSAALHEVTYLPLPEKEVGALSVNAVDVIRKHIERYKALVIGPGLGTEDSTVEFFSSLLMIDMPARKSPVGFLAQAADTAQSATKRKAAMGFMGFTGSQADAEAAAAEQAGLPALVIDADGLNMLAKLDNWADALRDHPVVLTPHPGEMARLLGLEQLEDAPQAAIDAAAEWGVVVVLKGPTTVIAAPDGKAVLHVGANPALATAGTGDVLAGLLGGLLAQGLAPFAAAQLAVGLHGIAGALVREALGVRGVIAGDVIERLPQAWQQLEEAGS